jgi:copper chaperone NosL
VRMIRRRLRPRAAWGRTLSILLVVLMAAGCSAKPRPLVAGEDACDFCRMVVSDPRFGGQVITQEGRLRTFDSVECLAGFIAAMGADTASLRGVWVADYATSAMIPAAEAQFLRGGTLHSPMGEGLAAFAATAVATELVSEYGGEVVSWQEVQVGAADHGDHTRPQ